jgi:hypothetical protein
MGTELTSLAVGGYVEQYVYLDSLYSAIPSVLLVVLSTGVLACN